MPNSGLHPIADTLPVIKHNLAGGQVMPGVRRLRDVRQVKIGGGGMKTDTSAYFPLGLVFGVALGALLGNAALGALLGTLTGLIVSAVGRHGG